MASTSSIRRFKRLYQQLPELEFAQSSAFLAQLARDPAFITTQILSSLPYASFGSEPVITATYGLRETSPCLQVFVWPAGAATPIHDHTSRGAYHCIVGSLIEERYERLDDGTQPSRARLRKIWQRPWAMRTAHRPLARMRMVFTGSATPVAAPRSRYTSMGHARVCSTAAITTQRANLCAIGWSLMTRERILPRCAPAKRGRLAYRCDSKLAAF